MADEIFHILSDMSPPVLDGLVRVRDFSAYNFRYQNALQVPLVSTTKYGKISFRFAAAVPLNNSSDNLRQVSSLINLKVEFLIGMVMIVNATYVYSCSAAIQLSV